MSDPLKEKNLSASVSTEQSTQTIQLLQLQTVKYLLKMNILPCLSAGAGHIGYTKVSGEFSFR